MPWWTLPNISSSTKFGAPSIAACTSYSAHELSTTVSSLLVVHNSTKHPVFTPLHINGKKVFFFDVTMMFFIFFVFHFLARNGDSDASDCCFHAKTCLKQGPRMLKIKEEVLSYVVGNCQIRGHTALLRQ